MQTFVSDRILDVAASGRSHLDPSFTYGAHTLTYVTRMTNPRFHKLVFANGSCIYNDYLCRVPSLLQAEGSPFEGLGACLFEVSDAVCCACQCGSA